MKKKLFALAMAGTTAFSVFGGAIGAAASGSTHIDYHNDAYVSYERPAQTITVTGSVSVTEKSYIDKLNPTKGSMTEAELSEHLKTVEVQENYVGYSYLSATNVYLSADQKSLSTGEKIAELDDASLLAKLGISVITGAGGAKTYAIGSTGYTTLSDAVKALAEGADNLKYYWNQQGGWSTSEKTPAEYAALPTLSGYRQNNIIVTSSTTTTNGENSVKVDGSDYAEFRFDAAITDPLDTRVSAEGVLYAYDFYYNNPFAGSPEAAASAWNKGEIDKLVEILGVGEFHAETGLGSAYKGVRQEVIGEWNDFLDTLAINADNGYHESYAEFVKNYTDRFYDDPIYDIHTGQLVGTNKVDIYNITGLLSDIYELNSKEAYKEVNTSQLVYLMQQYDKYIGEYIDTDDVAATEWGELLTEILQSANEEDFKKAADYKKYQNKVEDLVDAYEGATTVNMISAAEKAMVELLTSAPYTTSGVEKDSLEAGLYGLYFNADKIPATYETDSTAKNNGALNSFSYAVSDNSFALYPMADFAERGNKNTLFTGNEGSADYLAGSTTDEYQWFYNVYELAAKMNRQNKYQGSIDAVTEALTDAVEALSVTTAPAGSLTLAMEEMMEKYEGKLESDYTAVYFSAYEDAYAFAEKAEGKEQTLIASRIVKMAGSALEHQGVQVTVTKKMISALRDAIKNGEKALSDIKESSSVNAAQVTALNKALAEAEDLIALYEGSFSTSKLYQSVNGEFTAAIGDKDQMVVSDVKAAVEAIDSAIDFTSVLQGWSKNENGDWQYGTEEGYLNNGWNKIGKTWFYFDEDGTAKESEWMKENGKWYWFNSNCGAASGWAKVDGDWYYFKGDNSMKTGWEKVDGSWYYMASTGKMVTGWQKIDGKWYYFSKVSNSLGQMLSGTTTPDGYKVDANGVWVK